MVYDRSLYSRTCSRRRLLKGVAGSAVCGVLGGMRPSLAQGRAVRIGVLLPLTGDAEGISAQMWAGVEAGIAQLNATGGVLGRRVEAVYRDSEAHPNNLAQHCLELVDTEQVVAMIGPFIAASRKFASRHLAELGIPLVNATNHEGRFCHPNLFTLGPTPAQDVAPLVAHVDGGTGRNYFLVGSYPSWQNSMFRQSRFRIADHGGHVLGQALTDVGETDFEPILKWISHTDAEVVLFCIPRMNGPLFIQQANRMGLLERLTFAWIGFNEMHHEVLATMERERVITCSSFVMSDETPEVRDFVGRVQKSRSATFPVTYYAHNHASAVVALGEAWTKAGEVSGTAALETLSGLSFSGANGAITIDAESHHCSLNLSIARGSAEHLKIIKRLGSVGAEAGCTL